MNPTCEELSSLRAAYLVLVAHDGAATAMALLLFGSVLAVLTAPAVLRAYAEQVRRLMLLRQVEAPPDVWKNRQRRRVRRSNGAVAATAFPTTPSFAELDVARVGRRAVIKRATWIAYGVFVLGSSVIVKTAGSIATRDVIGFLLSVPALAVVPALVNLRPQGSKTRILIGMIALGVILAILEPDQDAGLDNAIGVPLSMGALYYVTSHRTLRSVVALMTAWLTAALTGVLAAIWFIVPTVACLDQRADGITWAVANGQIVVGLAVFTTCYYLGNKAILGLARLHERGVVSDISLAAVVGLVLIALLLAAAFTYGGSLPEWQVAVLTCAWVGTALVAYALTIRRSAHHRAQRSLLMLRVFSSSAKSHSLLDSVQAEWRAIGPVYQIAGPDLARLNVDASELSHFMTGRLHEIFLLGETSHEDLAPYLNDASDLEGRFRVNEVFCLESAWRNTVEQLMVRSDAIALDVRGFHPRRDGTGFEIELLARHRLLSRVLAVGDDRTDWHDLEERIRNAGGVPADMRRADAAGGDVEALTSALMQGATRTAT